MTPLEQKQRNRFALLRRLYEITDGVPGRHSIDIRSVGRDIGLDEETALNTFQYLNDEGLTQWMALGGFGTIAHWGVKEVEDAVAHKPTPHFPANIVVVTGSPGANIVAGAGNTVNQRSGQVGADSALELALKSVPPPLSGAANRLVAETRASNPNPFELARLIAQLVEDEGVKEELARFRRGLTSKQSEEVLAKAIDYVMEDKS